MQEKKAIIIGATSGIGKALAFKLAREGYDLGLTGRRGDLLQELQNTLTQPDVDAGGVVVSIKEMDVAKTEEAKPLFKELVAEMGEVDLVVICAGVGLSSTRPSWQIDRKVIEVNVYGFVAMMTAAAEYFCKKGNGHIVGISSVASFLYHGSSSAYPASKAFVTNYMKGLRLKLKRIQPKIYITDIRPGYVDTPMVEHIKFKPFLITADKAADLIYKAIKKKKRSAYVPWLAGVAANFYGFLLRVWPVFFERFLK
jgi:short-subunit dehydrogenase